MQIVRDLAGYSFGRSDTVRKAMSKKNAAVMAEERKNFVYGDGKNIPGCVKNGIPAEAAEKIFDEMTDFAKYAFNKSHSVCYAVVGYQTAWLKYYYPVEFMAALMTSVMDKADKVSGYVEECKKMGIELLPPDINEGFGPFSVAEGKIRFGLSAIKNVGRGAVDLLVREREENGPYRSLTDFCRRIDGGEWNRRGVESLIKAGALDSLGGNRRQYMAVYKSVMDGIGQSKKNNIEGQLNLFDIAPDDSFRQTDELPKLKEFLPKERLAMEREVLGIYVSGHPLAGYEERFGRKVSCTSRSFRQTDEDDGSQIADGTRVVIGGMIMGLSVKYTKKNEKMAIVTLEDFNGSIEVLFFPKAYGQCSPFLKEEEVLLVRGRANVSADGKANVIADSAELLVLEGEDAPKSLWLKMAAGGTATVAEIKGILAAHKGDIPVYIYHEETKRKMKAESQFWVAWDETLKDALAHLLGEKNVAVKY